MLRVESTDGYVQDMDLRMPFHFGDVEITALPQLLLTADVTVDGRQVTGRAAEGLSPLWFIKDPSVSFADGLNALLAVVDHACTIAESLDSKDTVFDAWAAVHGAQRDWADSTEYPALVWGFGVSMVERALVDAYCRRHDTTFATALCEGALGVEPGRIYPKLEGTSPADLLPGSPARELTLRHTVGFTDPLTADDLGPDERLDDALPQTLAEYVDAHDLTHFKVKLSGDEAADRDRLAALASFFTEHDLGDYAVTLDANEQYTDAAAFKTAWNSFRGAPDCTPILDHVLYVEQPLDRHEALTVETTEAFRTWSDRPPVIIDESDARPESLGHALECGYDGTSHKNCKGVFRGIVNACLLEHRRRADPDREYILSGEDLTTVGPVSLLQDLAVVATLDVGHVERNGHHYFRGLSMIPDDLQDALVDKHDDLYRQHDDGFATVAVADGRIEAGSTVDAPFGYDLDMDASRFTPVEDWTFEP